MTTRCYRIFNTGGETNHHLEREEPRARHHRGKSPEADLAE